MKTKRLKSEQGFTIIELMIALSVLSALLLLSTLVMMQIGRLYIRGVNQATLQNATRNITDDLSSAIEFSGFTPATGSSGQLRAICVGTIRYSYILHHELGTDGNLPLSTTNPTNHVLWRDVMTNLSGCTPLDITHPGTVTDPSSLGGYEMVPEHTRLTNFIYDTPIVNGIYNIHVWAAYGDSDLVNESSGKPSCNGITGSQFCATSILNTSVSRRKE